MLKTQLKVTTEWLKEQNACAMGQTWFTSQSESDLSKVVKALIKDNKFEWTNWTIVRFMTQTQRIQYACYSAKQSLHLFEKQFPNDKRPRKAILAALKFAKDPSELNRSAAESAEWSAESAAWSAAWSAESAARSAAFEGHADYLLVLIKNCK